MQDNQQKTGVGTRTARTWHSLGNKKRSKKCGKKQAAKGTLSHKMQGTLKQLLSWGCKKELSQTDLKIMAKRNHDGKKCNGGGYKRTGTGGVITTVVEDNTKGHKGATGKKQSRNL